MKTNFIIYKATSPSGKVYIGFTSQTLEIRKKKHYTIGGEGRQGTFNINKFSRKIIDENGIVYKSLAEAGRSINAKGDDIRIGIKNKSLVRGMSFSYYQEGMLKSEKYFEKRYSPVFCHQTGKTYKTCTEAGRELGIFHQLVHAVASKKQDKTKGYTFEFVGGGL